MNTINLSSLPPQDLAKEASLRYFVDSKPGFSRMKKGDGFTYYDLEGQRISNKDVLERIESLTIPPAWENVWICPSANGHLQATGIDDKGRKQYLYHSKWSEISNLTKFDKMLSFSEVLPKIRSRVSRDMSLNGLKQDKILALVVWLLDNTYIRIGNDEYARDNDHYGLTTLRSKHVDITGGTVTLEFTGKSGKNHRVGITHPKVHKTIKKLEELPGYELFQYLDENGNRHAVDSQEVNDYLKNIARETVSAKDFRTWGGTVIAAQSLKSLGDHQNEKECRSNLHTAVCNVAKHLGNTPAVCKGYYIHPTVVQTYQNKILIPHFEKHTKSKIRGLDKNEYATVTLLKKY